MRFILTEAKEDIEKFTNKFGKDIYDKFIKYKDRLKNRNISVDITYHTKNTSKEDLERIISEVENKVVIDKETGKSKNNAKLVAENEHYKVYDILDWETSMNMGDGTGWCISGRYHTGGKVKPSQAKQYFNQYKDEGIDRFLFFMPKDNSKKYCLCLTDYPDKFEFWNAQDISQGIGQIPEDPNLPEFKYSNFELKKPNIIEVDEDKLDIQDIFLLSIEEYKKYNSLIPMLDEWWWLRSPGKYSNHSALVFSSGDAYNIGTYVDTSDVAVRPALRISNLEAFNLNPGDIIKIFKVFNHDIHWVVLDKDLVIAKEDIGNYQFDKESNNYETSEIKQYLYDWLKKRMKNL